MHSREESLLEPSSSIEAKVRVCMYVFMHAFTLMFLCRRMYVCMNVCIHICAIILCPCSYSLAVLIWVSYSSP